MDNRVWVLEGEQPGDYEDHYERHSEVIAAFKSREAAQLFWDALPLMFFTIGGEQFVGRTDEFGVDYIDCNIYSVPYMVSNDR